MKGKFSRILIGELEHVISKWYYTITLTEPSKLFIGIHQEDERIFGVEEKRGYLDIGIAVLKRENEEFFIVKLKENDIQRQVELEVDLDAGEYFIVPRTTGCYLSRPPEAEADNQKLIENGVMNKFLVSTIKDIFRKHDMVISEDLSLHEFRGMLQPSGRGITDYDFETILRKYPSTDQGITVEGLIEYFKDFILENGEEEMWNYLEVMGYDRDFYSVQSRSFILTMHSDHGVHVRVRDATYSNIDKVTTQVMLQKYGERKTSDALSLWRIKEQNANAFTYGVYNSTKHSKSLTFDCSKSVGAIFSTGTPTVSIRVPPNSWEFLLHAQAVRQNEGAFTLKPSLTF